MANILISLIFPLILTIFSNTLVNCQESPEVHLRNVKFADNKTNFQLHLNKNLLDLTKSVKNFTLECKSPYPVRWLFEGKTAPLQFNLTASRRLENGSDVFISELFIIRISSRLTGKWSCGLVNNSRIETAVFIFAEEYGYRGDDAQFLEYGKTLAIFGRLGSDVTIPCLSYKRDIRARLAKRVSNASGSGSYEEVEKDALVGYDSTKGFILRLTQRSQLGKYICYTAFNKTFDRVTISLQEKIDVTLEPPDSEVEVLENGDVAFRCHTNDTGLRVEMDNRGGLKPSGLKPGPDFVKLVGQNLGLHDEGAVACKVFNQENQLVFQHWWSYKVISRSDIKRRGWKYYFSRRLQQDTWACWAKSSNVPTLSFVQCTSPMECDIKSQCFSRQNTCDDVDIKGCSGGCALLAVNSKPGVLACNGDGVDNSRVELFIGVSGKLYNSTNRLEKDELIAKYNTGSETYAGTTVDLECVGSSFKFARGFHWIIRLLFTNETFRLDTQNGRTSWDGIANLMEYKEEFDPRGLITLKSKVKLLTTLIMDITCIAPHWDSFQTSAFPLEFNVKEPTPPKFSNSETSVDLNLGEESQTIFCDVSGVPQPTIKWMKDGEDIPRTVQVVNGGDTIFFEEVSHAQQGSYSCQATNPGGSGTKVFNLSVTDPKQKIILAVVISGVIFITILFLILALFWRRIQRQKAMLRNLTDAEIEEFLYGNPDAIDRSEDTNKQGQFLAYNRDYEFPKDYLDIQMEEKLGSGAYGLVIKGIARGLFPGEEETTVAIKTLQPNADITNFKALLIELKIMSVIGRHSHIVNLLGACTTDIRKRELFIIVEFCENGSLEKFLKNHRSDFGNFHGTVRYSVGPQKEQSTIFYENQPTVQVTKINIQTLLRWSCEIALGMEYLSSKKLIHGDLAARNILLTDKLFSKIGDFGLSRQLYEYTNYVKKQQAPLPWRWMAIESLCDMEFSHKSDVWAYGVTLWEIFSLGEIPFPGLSWTEDFVRKLRQGHRPPQPHFADDYVYNMMIECWRYVPADRPKFSELSHFFQNSLQQQGIFMQEPPPPPIRQKFNLQVNNQNYGITKTMEGKDV